MPSTRDNPPAILASRLNRVIAGIGGISAGLGAMVLVGWHMHLLTLIQLRPTLAPMQYNSALCFVLAGAAMVAWGWNRLPWATPALGGLVASLSGLTLMEYLVHANFGIDQLFFRAYLQTETSNLGRMSPVTSLCFLLAGLSLLSLGLRAAARWRPVAMGSAASLIVSITLVAVLGYTLGLPGTYGWGQLTRIAIHTAGGLCLVGMGLFTIAWSIVLRPGESTPRWLPVPLALGVLAGSLILYFALENKQNQEIGQTVRAGAESAKNQIAVRMDARIRSLVRMAKRWEFTGAPSRAAWEMDASNYVHDFVDLQTLEWIDATHRVRWIVPLAGNEAKLNLDLTQEARRKEAVELAEREHQPVITRIVTLFRSGLGFILYVPIVVNGKSDGSIAAVFNPQACLQRYLPRSIAEGEAIQIIESGQIFYERDAGEMPRNADWIVREKVELKGATWDLRMWPTPALVARLDSPLPEVVLCVGALGSLLLGAVCFFAQRSARQATETARANAALQEALGKVRTLEGLLPICATCKRVRNESGHWSQIDTYLYEHTNASLSHGYCPECAAKAFQEYGFAIPVEVQAALDAGNFE